MRVLFIGLASNFTEGMTYQENLLAEQVRADGNEVTIVADCHRFANGVLTRTNEENRLLDNGVRLIRKNYRNIMGEFVSGKIRAVDGLYEIIESQRPDIVFQHSPCSYEILTVSRYKQNNPAVRFYVRSHEDRHNSGTNVLSREVLHKMFYRSLVQRALPHIDKVFYITYETAEFLKMMYNIPNHMMEFFPLGGVIFEERSRNSKRNKIRQELGLKEEEILIAHTGKMNRKKRTEDVLEAFTKVPSDRLRLILIGSLSEDIRTKAERLVASDDRIRFLGWKSGDELLDHLCASDLYLQPGTQSATMQNAVCCRNAVAVCPYPSHKALLEDKAFYVESRQDIERLLRDVVRDADALENKRRELYRIASDVLDYRVLAARLYR